MLQLNVLKYEKRDKYNTNFTFGLCVIWKSNLCFGLPNLECEFEFWVL